MFDDWLEGQNSDKVKHVNCYIRLLKFKSDFASVCFIEQVIYSFHV